ncbi:MAG: hypothetical protein HYR85_01675 [Planctomycetes bacterium]|nr:hypothetical protein [Planctomycetota bacterium]MBI3845977.1 hypothetical protein [Planctomycetota bacterium]
MMDRLCFATGRSIRIRIACVAAAVGVVSPVSMGQVNWIPDSPASSPSARFDNALAFDSARNRTVLFGGTDLSFMGLADTWEWDGSNWTQASPATSPPGRSSTALAYDSSRGRTVLFGGTNATQDNVLGDTWEWDGTTWTQFVPATSPSARNGHQLAYDSARGRTVLFGGIDAIGTASTETWEWDGTNWILASPATSPPGRYLHGMAYDSARGRTVMFGGFVGFGNPVNDTWEWDGTNWTPVSPATSPSARFATSMAFEPGRARTVLFGGSENFGSFLDDTWEWNGTDWAPLATASRPPGRDFHAISRGPGCARLVLFAGLPGGEGGPASDTWEFGEPGTVTLASVAPHAGPDAGGELTHLFGSGFTTIGDTAVDFGGVAATVLSVTPTRIDVRTPAGTGTVDVRMVNSVCETRLAGAYTFVAPEIAARYGNVNVGAGEREDVLLLNSTHGDDTTREITLARNAALRVIVLSPSSRPTARFAAYVWVGPPNGTTLRAQPFSLGNAVFPTPLNVGQVPQPRKIFNNFDTRLGTANLPSTPAPSTLLNRPVGLGNPITVTFQGFIQDTAAIIPQHVSLTNAIVLRVP